MLPARFVFNSIISQPNHNGSRRFITPLLSRAAATDDTASMRYRWVERSVHVGGLLDRTLDCTFVYLVQVDQPAPIFVRDWT